MSTDLPRRYFSSEVQLGASLDSKTKAARCIESMVRRVGLPLDVVEEEVERDAERLFPRFVFDELTRQGVSLDGALLVDLGAGLGSASEEAVTRGARPIAVEPGSGWREFAAERLRAAGRGVVVAAVGEALPFRDQSIDVVVSLMVLEHVTSPRKVLEEVYRILKPGGVFYLACENYLGFREPHYRVAWFPLLPKRLGAAYLRVRGRPTEFLFDSLTYTTRPGVRRIAEDCGFQFASRDELEKKIASSSNPGSGKARAILDLARRVANDRDLARLAFRLREIRHLFAGPICETLRKPVQAHG